MFYIDFRKGVTVIQTKEGNYSLMIADKDTNSIIQVIEDFKSGYRLRDTFYRNYYFELLNKDTKEVEVYEMPKLKKVFIECHSKALGDCIIWTPIVEEFRKKHNCEVILNTYHYELLQPFYPDIKMKWDTELPKDIQASYILGYAVNGFSNGDDDIISPIDCRTLSLQEVACVQLGMDYKEIQPNFKSNIEERIIKEKYICYTACTTGKLKLWNNEKEYKKLLNHFEKQGYKLVKVGEHPNSLNGLDYTGKIEWNKLMNLIQHSEMFIGFSSGLSVLSWALRTKTVIIDGITQDFAIMKNDIIKVQNKNVCNGCWNDINFVYEPENIDYCPRKKDFECTKEITAEMVINKIKEYER